MNKIRRIIESIKNDGIIVTIKKIIYKIKIVIKRKIIKSNVNKICNKINFKKYKKVIIFENQFGWEKIMKQRPQQMANAADEGSLFLYGTTYMEIGTDEGIKKLKNNLYLIDLVVYQKKLIELCNDIKNKYLMIYSTDYIPMDVLKPYMDAGFKMIYEFVDGIDESLCGKETAELLTSRHKNIINNYDPYIVTTATKLYDSIKEEKDSAKLKLITNGAEYEYFANNKIEIPKEMRDIKTDDNIIIGYYGALASWFDYDLIKELAKKSPKYEIVLIGLDYDKTLDKSGILDMPNVHYLGKKKYEELAGYLHGFDICMIPFIINEITLSTSPVKVFEYMAARKPIVTTDLPECRKYKSILIGKDKNEFLEKIEQAITQMRDIEYLDLLTKEAKENDWKHKYNSLLEFISNGEDNEG